MQQVKQIVMPPQPHTTGAIHDDAGIATTAVKRYRTARPYVLLAHLYVLTRCNASEESKDTHGALRKDSATLGELLVFASYMVISAEFHKSAVATMQVAKSNRLVTVVATNERGEPMYRLTDDGMCFLRTGHKRRLALQIRKPRWMPEDVCRHCAEDEIEEWLDLVREERTRNAFGIQVNPTEFLDTFIQDVKAKVIYRSADVTPMWAGLLLK